MRFAHTKRDFDNIIQHMTPSGRKGDQAKNNAHVMAFLNQSIIGNADDDEEMQRFYMNLLVAPKDEPTPMYPVEQNDSRVYLAQRDSPREHRMLALIQGTELQKSTKAQRTPHDPGELGAFYFRY